MIQIPLFFSDASVMVTNVVVPMTFFLLIPLLRCEIVTNMVKCKYERSCFPNDSFNDKDCTAKVYGENFSLFLFFHSNCG